MSSPFRKVLPWINPFQIPSLSLPSQKSLIPWPLRGSLTETTTTDTVNGAVVASTTATITGGNVALLALIQVHVRHSVADGEYRLGLELYNGPTISDTPAFTVWTGQNIACSPTAGEYMLLTMIAPIYFARPSWTPGVRLIQVRLTPQTAGTLTIGNSAAGADDQLNVFILGALQT